MPSDLLEAARLRGGPAGLSAYVSAAVRRQIEREGLDDLIAVAEAEHGPIGDAAVDEKRDLLRRMREARHDGGRGVA